VVNNGIDRIVAASSLGTIGVASNSEVHLRMAQRP
jgi:hypothetical protein